MTAPKFPLGRVVMTQTAQAVLQSENESPLPYLARHVRGDWGEVDKEDRKENEFSLENDLRLLSAYRTEAGTRLWIITEADRSATTVLLPEDY